MNDKLKEISQSLANVLPSMIPDGYVIAFVIMPAKAEIGAEFMLGSIPAMVGGAEAIASIFEVVTSSHDEAGTVEEVTFEPARKH